MYYRISAGLPVAAESVAPVTTAERKECIYSTIRTTINQSI